MRSRQDIHLETKNPIKGFLDFFPEFLFFRIKIRILIFLFFSLVFRPSAFCFLFFCFCFSPTRSTPSL